MAMQVRSHTSEPTSVTPMLLSSLYLVSLSGIGTSPSCEGRAVGGCVRVRVSVRGNGMGVREVSGAGRGWRCVVPWADGRKHSRGRAAHRLILRAHGSHTSYTSPVSNIS